MSDEPSQVEEHEQWPEDIKAMLAVLNEQHQLFVLMFVGPARLNRGRAAKLAGYAPKNPGAQRVQGCRLLTNVNIKAAIEAILKHCAPSVQEICARLADHTEATLDDVLNVKGQFSIKKARQTGGIDLIEQIQWDKEGRCKIKMVSQQGAMDKLLRVEGAYKDNLKLSGALAHLTADDQAKLDKEAEAEAEEELEQWQKSRTD